MHKKQFLIVLISLLTFFAFALPFDTDIRQKALSLYGIADASGGENSFKNPAGIYLYDHDSKFFASVGYSGDVYLRTRFVGKYSSLSLDLDYSKQDDIFYRDFTFGFNAAYGYRYFGLGVGCYGGASMVKPHSGEFERLDDSQFFTIRVGSMYKLKDFTFGVLADNVFVYDSFEKRLSLTEALENLSAGAYWSQGKYSKRGRLNSLVTSVGIEFHNMLDKYTRAVAAGAETTIQLSNEYAVSLRVGSEFILEDYKNPSLTAGLSVKLDRFEIGSYIDVFSRTLGVNVSFIK